jgi:hypothetical protein
MKKDAALLLIALIYCAALPCSPPAVARQSPAKADFIPIVPFIVDFEYIPEYFIQWIKDDPRYSMIQAAVYQREPPVCMIVLTEKKTDREVYYSNSAQKVTALQHAGKTARLAKIDFRVVERVGQQPVYGFGFADENGQAVRWRFIPTSAATARGAGVGPGHIGRGLQWICRNLGTAAGEGTAVEIGASLSEAELWSEISAPPYFIAYRGFYQLGLTAGGLSPGEQSWRLTSPPADLQEGAAWVLTDENLNTRQLKITARKGDEVTIAETGPPRPYAASISFILSASAEGVGLRSVMATIESHKMRVRFKPDLYIGRQPPPPNPSEVAFQIDQDSREALIEGTVTVERQGASMRLRWHPKSPDWAKSQDTLSTIMLGPKGYKLMVK